MSNTNKTVLVTGGAGYVGSHACKALAQVGYTPVTYDSLIRGHAELVKWGPLEVGDVRDGDGLAEVMKRHNPFAVMHFAALTLVGESVANPMLYHRTNADGTASLLSAMQRHGVTRIIVSGTCAVYGIPLVNPITEETAIAPINPYGESKLAMENHVVTASATTGMSHVILRYFNAAGADPDGETGEWHEPETHLIPNVLRAAAGFGDRLRLYGDDYSTPDGTCIRDYIHVCDIAAAHVAALEHLSKHAGAHVFNLGSGTGFSVRQVIEAARRITGKDIPVIVEARRPGDPAVLVADASRIKQALRWSPQRSGLDDQVADAWRWVTSSGH